MVIGGRPRCSERRRLAGGGAARERLAFAKRLRSVQRRLRPAARAGIGYLTLRAERRLYVKIGAACSAARG